PQILIRIYRDTIDAHFVMKMWPRTAAALAHIADHITTVHFLALGDRIAGQVTVEGGDAASMIKDYGPTIAAYRVGIKDDSIGRGYDWLSKSRGDVNAAVE